MREPMEIHVSWIEPDGFQLEFDHDGRHLEIEVCGEPAVWLIEQDGEILGTGETKVSEFNGIDNIQELFNWLMTGDRRKRSDPDSLDQKGEEHGDS